MVTVGGNEGFLDGVGVDTVIDLGESALEVPIELEAVVFLVLEALELFHQINFEFRADPHSKFKGDIRMGVGAAIASRSGPEPNCVGLFDPLLDADLVAIQSGLTSNYGEFAIIKIGIEDRLPNAKELHRVPITKPISDKKISVLGPQHIRERNVIALLSRENRDAGSLHFDGGCFGFAHG